MNKDVLIGALVGFGILMGAVGTVSIANGDKVQSNHTVQTQNGKNSSSKAERGKTEPVVEIRHETVKISLPFETRYYDDPYLTKGSTRVDLEGKEGTKVIEYEVTYTNGKESSRKKVSETVTSEPIERIVANGTYVRPQVQQTQSCPNGSYVNTYGNTVCRPSTTNAGGATAICRDGTYSYSQSRRGTCSHHGGVRVWL